MRPIDISILIPAKDEALRLPSFLEEVLQFCRGFNGRVEIIVINDGSTDRTSEVVHLYQKRYDDLTLIDLPINRGKGYALKRGMFAAQGRIVVFLDADGSTPVGEISRHLYLFLSDVDIVIGSRVLKDDRSTIQALAHRRFIGTIFNAIVHTFLIKNIKDTQCGFKMFRRECIHNLFGRIYLNGFGVDLEILFVATQLGLNIKEVAVNWHHVDGSKVDLVKDSLRMLVNIFQIRSWHPQKLHYDHPHMSAHEIKAMAEAEEHHWWFKAKADFMKTALKNLPMPKMVLDAGCGTGHNARSIKSSGLYVGVDAVNDALLYSHDRGLKNLTRGNLKELPFQNGVFDLIVCFDVLEHIDDDQGALLELKRVLSDDGRMIIAVPAFRSLFGSHDVALSHMRRYDRKDLTGLLNDCALEPSKLSYWYASTFIPAYLIRRIRKWFPDHNPQSDTYKLPSPLINAVMAVLFKFEARLHQIMPMPFGTTLAATIRKKIAPQEENFRQEKRAAISLAAPV